MNGLHVSLLCSLLVAVSAFKQDSDLRASDASDAINDSVGDVVSIPNDKHAHSVEDEWGAAHDDSNGDYATLMEATFTVPPLAQSRRRRLRNLQDRNHRTKADVYTAEVADNEGDITGPQHRKPHLLTTRRRRTTTRRRRSCTVSNECKVSESSVPCSITPAPTPSVTSGGTPFPTPLPPDDDEQTYTCGCNAALCCSLSAPICGIRSDGCSDSGTWACTEEIPLEVIILVAGIVGGVCACCCICGCCLWRIRRRRQIQTQVVTEVQPVQHPMQPMGQPVYGETPGYPPATQGGSPYVQPVYGQTQFARPYQPQYPPQQPPYQPHQQAVPPAYDPFAPELSPPAVGGEPPPPAYGQHTQATVESQKPQYM